MPFADDVVADAELGILLRLIYHAGSKPVSRYELRTSWRAGDIRIDIARRRWPRTTMIWPDPARIAALFVRYAARDARSAFRNIFGGR